MNNSDAKIIDLGPDDYEIIDDEPMNMGQFYKKEAKESFRDGFLYLKKAVIFSVSSKKAKIGRIKTSVLNKAMLYAHNFDLKVKEKFEEAQIAGINLMSKGVNSLTNARNSVVNYTSEQIEKFRDFRNRLNIAKDQKASEKARREDEKAREKARKAEEQAKEKARKEEEQARKQEARREQKLNFKKSVKTKVSSFKCKIGKIKTDALNKAMLYSHNFDLKVKEKFEEAQIAGINLVSKGFNAVSNVKNSVVNYTSEQVEKFRQFKYNLQDKKETRTAEKMSAKNRKDSERIYESDLKARTDKHKTAMTQLLNEQALAQNMIIRENKKVELDTLKAQKQFLKEYLKQQQDELFSSKPKSR